MPNAADFLELLPKAADGGLRYVQEEKSRSITGADGPWGGRTLSAGSGHAANISRQHETRNLGRTLATNAMDKRRPHPASLSVVLAARHPSIETSTALRTVLSQVEAVEGELVIATTDPRAIPAELRSLDRVRVLLRSEGSVFDLRAAALAAASGDVVAVTEDHCRPTEGWASWLIAAHEANPGAAMIAGPVVNGSDGCAVDRANFLITFAEYLPPLAAAGFRRIPPIVNVSYKRAVLPHREPRPGWLEFELNPMLARAGKVALVGGPPVAHVQSRPMARTLMAHFHNGRSTAGMRDHVPRRRLARELTRGGLLPLRLTRHTVRAIAGKTRPRGTLRRDMVLVFALACCHGAGEATGMVHGPGRSAELLE